MKLTIKLLLIFVVLGLVFAIEFALVGDYFDVLFNQEQCRQWFARSRPVAWAIGIALLLSDILLPIPASGVMAALGTVYGIWLGATISAIGSMGAAYTGYLLARFAERRWLHILASPEEMARFKGFFDQWGGWAIIISRAMPILPEIIAILAGMAGMKNSRFAGALVLGTVPTCLFFSAIGHGAQATPWYGMALAVALPLLLWPVVLRLQRLTPRANGHEQKIL